MNGDCVPRVFDVTQLVPVTTRVWADDEAEAQTTGIAYPMKFLPTGNVIAVSVGFPESIEVKEVATE